MFEEVQPAALRASLRSSQSAPRGTVQLFRYSELEKTQDPRIVEFLQSKLVNTSVTPHTLTPKCHSVLSEIFFSFSGGKDGVLGAKQLNELQMASNGKPLTAEQIDYAFSAYKTKTNSAGEKGLSLEGFLDLYVRQCIDAPLDTFEELSKLGYDLNLNRNSYITLQQALESQEKENWPAAADAQLVEYVEILYTEVEVSSPVHLVPDHLRPAPENSSLVAFSVLAKMPLPALRLRFELLRQFNEQLLRVLPFVNFDRVHKGSLAYLFSAARSLIFHTSKMEYIYDVLDKTSVQGNQPTVNIDRLKLAAKKDKEPATGATTTHSSDSSNTNSSSGGAIIGSNNTTNLSQTMFGIAFQQLRNINPTNYRQKKPGGAEPHFGLKIVFRGENVQGEGGPYRQFFTDVSKELQGALPLFIPCPNAQGALGENRDKWIPNPSADSSNQIAMFEFVGRLMGLSIRTGVLLPMDLPTFFWKQVVGLPAEAADLRAIDESFYTTLRYLATCSKDEFETVCIDETFTTYLSNKARVPLKEGGENIHVTFENRDEYVRLAEQVRLRESSVQIAAIRRGLGDIVPLPLLHLCHPRDVEWKVCGKPFIDISLLRRHTLCSGISPEAPHISYFWQTLQDFNQQDRRGFLRFAWAQERLPVNDEEFERTKTRMMIKPFPNLPDPNSAFPKADTCFFNIMLPEYTSQRVLRERLLYAIYTDSHSMNADEPQEDELTTVGHRGGRRGAALAAASIFSPEYSSESEEEE